jgi:hypothetical protein
MSSQLAVLCLINTTGYDGFYRNFSQGSPEVVANGVVYVELPEGGTSWSVPKDITAQIGWWGTNAPDGNDLYPELVKITGTSCSYDEQRGELHFIVLTNGNMYHCVLSESAGTWSKLQPVDVGMVTSNEYQGYPNGGIVAACASAMTNQPNRVIDRPVPGL